MALTDAQARALDHILAAWDDANARNLARWGVPLEGGVSVVTGVGAGCVARDARTLHALDAAGLIELRSTVEASERLRRGAYGRWVGGSERLGWVAHVAKPTPAARLLRGVDRMQEFAECGVDPEFPGREGVVPPLTPGSRTRERSPSPGVVGRSPRRGRE